MKYYKGRWCLYVYPSGYEALSFVSSCQDVMIFAWIHHMDSLGNKFYVDSTWNTMVTLPSYFKYQLRNVMMYPGGSMSWDGPYVAPFMTDEPKISSKRLMKEVVVNGRESKAEEGDSERRRAGEIIEKVEGTEGMERTGSRRSISRSFVLKGEKSKLYKRVYVHA